MKEKSVSIDITATSNEPEVPINEEKKKSVLIRWIGGVDRPFLFIVILLMSLGTIMIFSASYAYAKTYFHDSYYFAKRQVGYAAGGVLVMLFTVHFFKPSWIRRCAWIGWLLAIVGNGAVAMMGFIGHGAQRWIDVGLFSFQPSEVLKFMTIIVCARMITDNQDRIKKFKYGIFPFALILIPSVILMYFQSHLSAMIIITLLIYFMMFLGGSNGWIMGSLGGIMLGFVVFVVNNIRMIANLDIIKNKMGHVYKRLIVWEDPFTYMRDLATNDAGWQPAQSLYAISSGGVFGVGLGQSIQKHGYLPEPQNDYIFAIICEETGFIGALIVIALFVALIIRGFIIARNCKDRFNQLSVYGLMMKIGLQVILNIGVVTNILPSTGISLPFFSYGGTALVITMLEMGIVLSISRFSYTERGGEE